MDMKRIDSIGRFQIGFLICAVLRSHRKAQDEAVRIAIDLLIGDRPSWAWAVFEEDKGASGINLIDKEVHSKWDPKFLG